MPEEFYRGGSRSPFKAAVWAGAVTLGTAGASTTMLTVQGNTIERLKRVKVICQVPKSTAVIPGWVAFYREDPGTTTQVADLEASSPQVLRPQVFINNSDHAVYLELYLEAITLDAGGKLHILAKSFRASGSSMGFVAKWYSESSIR